MVKLNWLEKVLRSFDQYLGVWVGLLLASTVLMGWVEKMFVWRLWDPEKEMYATLPMFPTPSWWTDPLGVVSVLIGGCLAKLAAGYYTNSRYNSPEGKPPEVRSDKFENTPSGT